MGRTSQARIRKREIVEQFYELLKQEGIERASMIKVAKRMGIYPSHVNHYFPTKEQLISELVEFFIERYEKEFSASLFSTATGIRRLSDLLDALMGLEWAAEVDSGVFYSIYYLSLKNDAIHRSLAGMYQRFREILVSVLEECRAQGLVRFLNAEEEAHNIIAMVEGLDFYSFLYREPDAIRSVGKAFKEMIWARLEVPGSRSPGDPPLGVLEAGGGGRRVKSR